MKRAGFRLLAAALLILSLNLFSGGLDDREMEHIKLATTTSTENSGLLAELLPPFQEKYNLRVDVIAVGTGKAIAHGENGDVDLILVHARSREDSFVDAGYGINRRDVMYNDFVLLGSADDPAGIKGMADAAEAFKKIAEAQADFISRGDDSGTHTKERSLWSEAGISPSGSWYMETGQGMGTVLSMTSEIQGYALTDRATWLSMKDKLELVVLVEGDKNLYNPYGVIAVSPEKHDHVNYEGAMAFIGFITSPGGQEIIGNFKKGGEKLFFPDALK